MDERLPVGKEMAILHLLIGSKEMYGLQMVKEVPEQLNRNSIYVILTRMVARGLLEARNETKEEQKVPGPKRRLFKMTGYGQKMYNAKLAADKAAAAHIAAAGPLKPQGSM